MTMNYHALSFRIITVLLFFFWHLTSFAQHTSLEKANKKTIIRYFEEVVNTQKLNSIGAVLFTGLHLASNERNRCSQQSG
jgi:hypothetical protein